MSEKVMDGIPMMDVDYTDGTQVHEEVESLPDPSERPNGQIIVMDGNLFRNNGDEWRIPIGGLDSISKPITEQEMDLAVNSEQRMDNITDLKFAMDKVTDSEIAMDLVTDSEIAMDSVTDKEMPMDKVTDKEMPMDAVTDKEVAMDSVTDKEMPMDLVTDKEMPMDLVTDKEMPMDLVADSEIAMDKVTDKEMPMDKVTDKEMPMDKVTDKEVAMDLVTDKQMPMDLVTDKQMPMDMVTDKQMPMDKVISKNMAFRKFLLSTHILDTCWTKETSSTIVWKSFNPEPPHEFDRSEVTLEDSPTGGKLLRFTRIQDISGEDSIEKNIDFTDVDDLKIRIRADTFGDTGSRMLATLKLDGDELINLDGNNDELEEYQLDVSSYDGVTTLELIAEGTRHGDDTDNYEVEFDDFYLR